MHISICHMGEEAREKKILLRNKKLTFFTSQVVHLDNKEKAEIVPRDEVKPSKKSE